MLTIERFEDEHLSIDDFKKRKKKFPYKNMRTNAKFENFGFEFGQTAMAFGLGTLKDNWEEKDCDQFIDDQNLHDRVAEIAIKRKLPVLDAKYVACAEVLRTAWFILYPGIETWINQCIAEGVRDGYVRSPFGARRLVPELTYKGGAGEDANQRHMKNLKNITVNTRVQNHEAVVMNRAQHIIHSYIKKHLLKTKIIGNVHDATVKYLHRDETKILLPIIHQAFSMDYPENRGIPYEGETNLADPMKNEPWGFGPIEIGPKEALQGDFEKVELEKIAIVRDEDDEDEYIDLDELEDYEGDY